jgi:type I restriction enzyme, S subunit
MHSHQEDWIQELISDVVIHISAGWSPQCEGYPASGGEWGVLKTTSIQWDKFVAYEKKALPKSMQPRPSLTIQKGDVLVTRAGPRQRIGVVAAARENHSNLMISGKIIRLKPDLHKIDPRFLEISLSSPFSQEYLVSRKTGLADAQVNISQSIIRSMPISYPSLPEQHRIISYLDVLQSNVDTAKRLRQESLKELDALLPAILDKAFKGEL